MNYGDNRLPKRFWAKVYPEPNTGCWLWGAATQNGYGVYVVRHHVQRKPHRFLFEVVHGYVPAWPVGQIDHICRVRSCVNPQHLELVTAQENTARSKAIITVCPQGHTYSDTNTYINERGQRSCRSCRREVSKKWRENHAR